MTILGMMSRGDRFVCTVGSMVHDAEPIFGTMQCRPCHAHVHILFLLAYKYAHRDQMWMVLFDMIMTIFLYTAYMSLFSAARDDVRSDIMRLCGTELFDRRVKIEFSHDISSDLSSTSM